MILYVQTKGLYVVFNIKISFLVLVGSKYKTTIKENKSKDCIHSELTKFSVYFTPW